MDSKAVETQINQMISFIRSEASEKANEISLQAKAEFDIEKQRLVEEEKVKIRREFERREKQIEVEKKMYVASLVLFMMHFFYSRVGSVGGLGFIRFPPPSSCT
jgi:hypothetical protein